LVVIDIDLEHLRVSVDNIDYIHGYSRVYSGKQGYSWHGTTIQFGIPNKNKNLRVADCDTSKRPHMLLSPYKDPSGINSPYKKKMRRSRTGMESQQYIDATVNQIPSAMDTSTEIHILRQTGVECKMADFILDGADEITLKSLAEASEIYMLLKSANVKQDKHILDIQGFLTMYNNIQSPLPSDIVYYKVLDQKCDNKDTLLNVISDLQNEFILKHRTKYIVLEGDQATYERLHSVGTNFKRTHHFLLEVWESMYRVFLGFFLAQPNIPSDLKTFVCGWIDNFPESEKQEDAVRNLKEMIRDIYEKCAQFHVLLREYLNEVSKNNTTISFWCQFVLRDCFAYVSLWYAIRSGNWDLRIAAIKEMAALFVAFDRPNYTKLISHHLQTLKTIPDDILSSLKQAFTLSIKGRAGHSIAIDEAHEMCINRQCKECITRPSPDYK